jgi:hypothetical protein
MILHKGLLPEAVQSDAVRSTVSLYISAHSLLVYALAYLISCFDREIPFCHLQADAQSEG